jgi:hypothetical protein
MREVTSMDYASDGRCHNSEPGTFGHECGKPAEWIGTKPSGFRTGFCARCKEHGAEAKGPILWERVTPPGGYVAEYHGDRVAPFGYGATAEEAKAAAHRQIIGADRAMMAHMLPRIRCRPLHVDEASQLLEYLGTPWP